MDQRWLRLQDILSAAWDLPREERDPYFVQHAAGDASLLAELRELSAAHDALACWTPPESGSPPASDGRRIGPYEIERLLGRGGMGAVYLARRADGEFTRHVALKLIGLPFDLDTFRESFRRERQILAALNHPNIAHLLDGGTTAAGQLYLAMEYIEGEAIGAHARRLPLAGRLRLFREVCAGAQYAHQHLVVHRDIKPSNILVTPEGVPKLLDFGAARLLSGAEGTATGFGMMTVAYASPEQLRGEPATTLSDVFSLGALLFELASGQPAFGGDVVSRTSQIASGRDGLRLPASLSGDLGRVVRKALALDPAQRYTSVEQLSEDVRRFLAAEPVIAHPPRIAYRAGKFLRRHALGAGLAAGFVLLLAAATAFSIREAQFAQREAARAQSSNQFLTSLFRLPFFDASAHHDMTVRELLDLAARRVTPVLGADPATAADVDLVLGGGLASQQDWPRAKDLFERALARARQSSDLPRQAAAISWLGAVAYDVGDAAGAWKQSLDALHLWEHAPKSFPPEDAAAVLTRSGQILQYLRPADPVNRAYLEQAVRICRLHPDEVETVVRAASRQALAESYLNSPGDAQSSYRAAYPLVQEAVALDRSDPTLAAGLIESLQTWGRINRFLEHYDVDEAAQREVYQMLLRLAGPDHAATASQRAIWSISLAGIGNTAAAWSESQQALATMRRIYAAPGSLQLWTNTAAAAYAACLTGRFRECESLAREATLAIGPDPQPADLRLFEAKSYLALALAGQGRSPEALPLLAETVNFYRSRNRKGPLRAALEQAYARAASR